MKSIPYVPFAPKFKYSFDVREEKWIPIKPRRFVYHLTNRGKRIASENQENYRRLSIALEGLYGIEKGFDGVWANNQLECLWSLYPVNLDSMMFSGMELLEWLQSFDVWRIDTSANSNRWYVDPNHMLTHPSTQEDYVFTRESVPAYALKLYEFEFKAHQFLNRDWSNIEFNLKPVGSINRTLEIQRARKKRPAFY